MQRDAAALRDAKRERDLIDIIKSSVDLFDSSPAQAADLERNAFLRDYSASMQPAVPVRFGQNHITAFAGNKTKVQSEPRGQCISVA
jgi:hypothetical protein